MQHFVLRFSGGDEQQARHRGRIQGRADEAERGYDVEQLRKRDRKPIGDGPQRVVPVRFDEALLAALTERAERDHISRSEAIRAAIRSYVA